MQGPNREPCPASSDPVVEARAVATVRLTPRLIRFYLDVYLLESETDSPDQRTPASRRMVSSASRYTSREPLASPESVDAPGLRSPSGGSNSIQSKGNTSSGSSSPPSIEGPPTPSPPKLPVHYHQNSVRTKRSARSSRKPPSER